jgi:hypothetical protein
MEELPDKKELEEKIKNLVGFEKRYYKALPDECWMAEENQVKLLNEGSITRIGKTRLRTVKKKLIKEGLLKLELAPNGNRKNLKHKLRKTYSIILEREGALLPELSSTYTPEDEEYTLVAEINWALLKTYTAQDINEMDKIAKIQLYMDCGFIVLPTNYPKFTENGVKCSCYRGLKCSNIGKHPVHKYKDIDFFNYEGRKSSYLKEFENKPALNIGFKVMGYSVLDVDNKHNGNESLAKLLYESDIEMNNVISVTCSNGQHIYASNTSLKNTAGFIGHGLDIRSEGVFIVAPGSLHKTGTVYEWNEIGEVATLPEEWFYTEIEENETHSEKKSSNRSNVAVSKKLKDIKLPKVLTADYRIPEGERELTLFSWASRERGNGKNAEQIYDILITIRDTYCDDGEEPVPDEEIRNIANSAAIYDTNAQKRLSGTLSRNS